MTDQRQPVDDIRPSVVRLLAAFDALPDLQTKALALAEVLDEVLENALRVDGQQGYLERIAAYGVAELSLSKLREQFRETGDRRVQVGNK